MGPETLIRRTGTLSLFLVDPSGPPDRREAYARLRLCRGFLDDLNRLLPIRMRIRIETEIAQGRTGGRMEAPGPGPAFAWEFSED
jgi:hypothetical protein